MTKRSPARQLRTDAAKKKHGVNTVGAAMRIDREKTARCWYELKNVHKRSTMHFQRMAHYLLQYMNPMVQMQIAKNNQSGEFDAGIKEINALSKEFGDQLEALWDLHKDKKHRCTNHQEFAQALDIFEKYAQFDTSIYDKFSPVIEKLSAIFNKAIDDLRAFEAAQKASGQPAPEPTIIGDKEVSTQPTIPAPADPVAFDRNDVSAISRLEEEPAKPVEPESFQLSGIDAIDARIGATTEGTE